MKSRTGIRQTRRALSWVLLGVLVTLAHPALADEVQISDKARDHFRAGVNFMQDPDGARYEEAYREFKTAYADSPSWKILGNLGIAAMKLERDGEAIEAFQKYLSEGGTQVDQDERAQFERDLQTLQASVVRLTLKSEPPGATVTDERVPVHGEPIVNVYGPLDNELTIGVRPGHHRITARLKGYVDTRWEFDSPPSSTDSHVLTMAVQPAGGEGPGVPPPGGGPAGGAPVATQRPVPVGVYVGLVATGLLAVGAGVTGVLATKKKGDFEDVNNGTDPAKAEELRDSGQRLNLITDALLGGAVVAGAVTAILFLNRPEVPAEREAGSAPRRKKSAAFYVSPAIGARSGGVTLFGAF